MDTNTQEERGQRKPIIWFSDLINFRLFHSLFSDTYPCRTEKASIMAAWEWLTSFPGASSLGIKMAALALLLDEEGELLVCLRRGTPPARKTLRNPRKFWTAPDCQLPETQWENQLVSLNQKQWLSKKADASNWWTKVKREKLIMKDVPCACVLFIETSADKANTLTLLSEIYPMSFNSSHKITSSVLFYINSQSIYFS